jgi:hypothetical protein
VCRRGENFEYQEKIALVAEKSTNHRKKPQMIALSCLDVEVESNAEIIAKATNVALSYLDVEVESAFLAKVFLRALVGSHQGLRIPFGETHTNTHTHTHTHTHTTHTHIHTHREKKKKKRAKEKHGKDTHTCTRKRRAWRARICTHVRTGNTERKKEKTKHNTCM